MAPVGRRPTPPHAARAKTTCLPPPSFQRPSSADAGPSASDDAIDDATSDDGDGGDDPADGDATVCLADARRRAVAGGARAAPKPAAPRRRGAHAACKPVWLSLPRNLANSFST